LPFTPRAQRALERAGRFARKQQEPEVGAGHVLLGVLDVEGLACQVLRGLGADIAQVREAMTTTRDEVQVASVSEQRASEATQPRCPRCRALLADTLSETLMPARGDDEPATNVCVVYCSSCGTTLGVVRPESS
jgi:ATP-dependent Clp protease ATP-binding subunit ClpA